MKNCTPLWREAHLEENKLKTPGVRTTFRSCDVEKVHAVVVRSTFPSQNVQSTPFSDYFWKLRCRKSARRCRAKHVSKSKCTKHILCSDHFWRLRCRFASLRFTRLHYITLHSTTLHYTTLHYTPLHYNYNCKTTPHYTPLH